MDSEPKFDGKLQIEILFRILSSLDIITVLDIVSKWKCKRTVPSDPSKEFIERAVTIKKGIGISFDNALIVWCPRNSLKPDFIATILGKISRKIELQIKWNPFPIGIGEFISGVVKFNSPETARKAAKELSMMSRSVVTLPLHKFLDLFVSAEIRHPLCGEDSTVVVVSGKRGLFTTEEKEALKTKLKLFGDIVDYRFHEKLDTPELGIICSVSYAYASQAYAAKYYLDGLFHKILGRLSIEVKENEKEKHMMKLVKRRMIEYLDENRVVHT